MYGVWETWKSVQNLVGKHELNGALGRSKGRCEDNTDYFF